MRWPGRMPTGNSESSKGVPVAVDHHTCASITSCELLSHPRIVPAMLQFISRHRLLPGSVREISKHGIDQPVGALILGNDLPRDVWCFSATIFRANRKLRLSFTPQSHQKNRLRHDSRIMRSRAGFRPGSYTRQPRCCCNPHRAGTWGRPTRGGRSYRTRGDDKNVEI
jgi:hypothetical protein